MVGLGVLPGADFSSQATGVSADGGLVVGMSGTPSPTTEAFGWSSTTGMVGIGDLPESNFFSQAFAASADGSVIVGRGNQRTGTEAFRWTQAGGIVGLGFLPGGDNASVALAVSADGNVVVGVGNVTTLPEAFIWDAANGMLNLRDVALAQGADLAGWTLSFAAGVSADGRTIVGGGINPAGSIEAFVLTLDAPGGS